MSRTNRRKNQNHLISYYSRAYGYATDNGWIDGKTGPYIDWVEATPQRAFRNLHVVFGDGNKNYWSSRGMNRWSRKVEEHRHRKKEKAKITRFLKGIDEDVVASKLMKFPMAYW